MVGRKLFESEPSEENRQLLVDAVSFRARELRQQGKFVDASVSLTSIARLKGMTPENVLPLSREVARCGDYAGAMELLKSTPPTEDRPQLEKTITQYAVDVALCQQKHGREHLPEDLHEDFDRILHAFEHSSNGEDDQAIEQLKGIGLRSPFLEWKLLLRGLLAYYQGEDVRAVENWERLADDRIPARLIAALRSGLDSAYRERQSPEARNALQNAFRRLQGISIDGDLAEIQELIGSGAMASVILQRAERIVPALKQQQPELVPRLANCLYWVLIQLGEEHDTRRYLHLFGPPQDDPSLHRLNAIAFENYGNLEEAHTRWQSYEKEIATQPDVWPGEQADRARALIWLRMGINAVNQPDLDDLPSLGFGFDLPVPRKLNPGAEKCFEESLKLAPESAAAHQALLSYYRSENFPTKALKVARDLAKLQPDRPQVMEQLGELLLETGKGKEAIKVYQQAYQRNPMDPNVRLRLSTAHLIHARNQAEIGKFDEAREGYQTARQLSEHDPSGILCKWAACEIKAGDEARGEELLQEALQHKGSELAVTYSILIETIRLKLKHAYKKRFNDDLNEGLAKEPTAEAVVSLTETTAVHQAANISYVGQKTHRTKVMKYVNRALDSVKFEEAQLERLCGALLRMEEYKKTKAATDLGSRQFPQNPLFLLLSVENEINRGPMSFSPFHIGNQISRAERLLQNQPNHPRREELLARIIEIKDLVDRAMPFSRIFGSSFFDPFDDFGEDDDFEDPIDF